MTIELTDAALQALDGYLEGKPKGAKKQTLSHLVEWFALMPDAVKDAIQDNIKYDVVRAMAKDEIIAWAKSVEKPLPRIDDLEKRRGK